jgi:hypothetical protein
MKTPDWSQLGRLGRNQIVRSAYLWLLGVPVLAKLLSHLPDKLPIMVYGKQLELYLSLPFSWAILFFSAAAFTLGELFFTFGCPPLIRDYKDVEEFKGEGRTASQVMVYMFKFVDAQKSFIWNLKKSWKVLRTITDCLHSMRLLRPKFWCQM